MLKPLVSASFVMNSSADLYVKCEVWVVEHKLVIVFLWFHQFFLFADFYFSSIRKIIDFLFVVIILVFTLIFFRARYTFTSNSSSILHFDCSEVFKGLNKTRGIFLRYRELLNEDAESATDLDNTTTELRNSLRSIEWDLEDLEDTIAIAEKNPKHKVNLEELNQRRQFINATKNEIKSMKEKISILKNRDKDITAIQPLLDEPSPKIICNNSIGNNLMSTMAAARHSGTKYSKLENMNDSPSHHGNYGDSAFLGETVSIQQRMLQSQDEQLDVLSDTIGTLRTVSRQIGVEIDEQAV